MGGKGKTANLSKLSIFLNPLRHLASSKLVIPEWKEERVVSFIYGCTLFPLEFSLAQCFLIFLQPVKSFCLFCLFFFFFCKGLRWEEERIRDNILYMYKNKLFFFSFKKYIKIIINSMKGKY